MLLPSSESDPLAHKVPWEMINGQRSCVFYSKYFIRQIMNLDISWELDFSYRITGKCVSSHRALLFPLEDSRKVEME
jgi:hypothetical protein